MNTTLQEEYSQLSYYTLAHGGKDFIHQHVVDAIGAQEPSPDDKPIRLAFALIGLCLHVEYGFTGRQVQQAHAQLADKRKDWPVIVIPNNRGEITVSNVLAAPAPERDSMIHRWCRSVWQAYAAEHDTIRRLIQSHKIVDAHCMQQRS